MAKSNYQSITSLKRLYAGTRQIQTRGEFLRRYSIRTESLHDIVFNLVSYPRKMNDTQRVLDIGAGNGSLLKRLSQVGTFNTLVALDIAESEALSARKDINYILYDGKHLPQLNERLDYILMMHMLYHVEDIRTFLSNVREMYCKKSTKLIITTKSKYTMPGMERLFKETVAEIDNDEAIQNERDEAHFCLENAKEILEEVFPDKLIHEKVVETKLRVDSPDALLQYILSTPRYNLSSPDYAKLLSSKIKQCIPFEDSYTEVLYVIE